VRAPSGDLFVSNMGRYIIVRIDTATGFATRIAGTGRPYEAACAPLRGDHGGSPLWGPTSVRIVGAGPCACPTGGIWRWARE
jgi:hypothetical protein